MSVKLTDQLVKKFTRDNGSRKDVLDAVLPGLVLRVGPCHPQRMRDTHGAPRCAPHVTSPT